MSIYGSTLAFDGEDHEASCARMRPLGPDDELEPAASGEISIGVLNEEGAFQLIDGDCDCAARFQSAIRYEGSHVYPDPANRGAEMDFGIIPGHIAEEGYAEDHEHWAIACHRPFLRVGFRDPYGNAYPRENAEPTSGTILLDAKQVEELRDYLSDFLDRITGEWCLAAESKEQREAAFAEFLTEMKAEQA